MRSLYVVKDIMKGEKFTNENIKSIRPSFGLHPKHLDKFINKKSTLSVKAGSRLKRNMIKKF